MNKTEKGLLVGLVFCFLLASVLAQGPDTTDPDIVGIIPGPELPEPETPVVPEPPSCPGGICPVTGGEFEWINNPAGPDSIALTVTNELVNDTTMKVCWTYPDGFNPTSPAGVAFFEAIFLEESFESEDFKQIFEVGSEKKELLGNKCIEIPVVAPAELQPITIGDFEGKIHLGYSQVKPDGPNGLKRRTLIVSGYSTGSGEITISESETRTGEILVFSVSSSESSAEGRSRILTLTIVPKASGEKSSVWVNLSTLIGVSAQRSARTAVQVAESMVSSGVGYNYYFKEDDLYYHIDGPSAGGARTALAHSLLTSKTLNEKAGVTGTIGFDGKIGMIGGANLKAGAANKLGSPAEKFTFLVPQGQQSEVTGSYPNLIVKEVNTVSDVLAELEGAAGDNSAPVGTIVSGSKAVFLAKGIAPEIADNRQESQESLTFVSVNVGNNFATKNEITGNQFDFDSSIQTKIPQSFELELSGINKNKPLILGVGKANELSCEKIAVWVNQGKLKLDEGWMTKAVGAAESAFDWVKGFLGDNTQVQEGVKKFKTGEWLSGGAQITGAELGRLLVGAGRAVVWGVKGVGIVLREGGTAIYKEIVGDVGTTSGTPVVGDGTTGGMNVSELISQEVVQPSKYLQINAEANKIYPIGNSDWATGLGLKPLWLLQKIDGKEINATSFGNGKQIRFIACQFSLDASNPDNPVLIVDKKDEVTIQFGKVKCNSILECLLEINKKFLNIFTGN